MTIEHIDTNITIIDFHDRHGIIRSTAGCSLKGKIEFDQRFSKLVEILNESNPNKTIAKIYEENDIFRYNCDRCLELNAIDPDWVNETILENLLFNNNGKFGALISLNTPRSSDSSKQSDGKAATYPELLAAIASYTQNLEQAMNIAENKPAKEVWETIEEIAKIHKENNPSETKKNKNSSETKKAPKSEQVSREQDDWARIRLAKAARNK